MKKLTFLVVFFIFTLASVFAQGFYFDLGIGIGKTWTKINGEDVSDIFSEPGIKEIGVDFGVKAGYGPIAGSPFYIVGAFEGIGHRFSDSSNYIQFNSYLIGPGLIYYPVPMLQLAGSIGISFLSNKTDISGVSLFGNEGPGFVGDVSIAFDLGSRNNGFLFGLRYFGAVNKLEVSNAKQNTSALTFFGRYAFRKK